MRLDDASRHEQSQPHTKPSLTLVRRLEASPARVFAAWTDPAQVTQWMRPLDNECIHAENDRAAPRW